MLVRRRFDACSMLVRCLFDQGNYVKIISEWYDAALCGGPFRVCHAVLGAHRRSFRFPGLHPAFISFPGVAPAFISFPGVAPRAHFVSRGCTPRYKQRDSYGVLLWFVPITISGGGAPADYAPPRHWRGGGPVLSRYSSIPAVDKRLRQTPGRDAPPAIHPNT
ncbi:hypothetical protein CLV42_103582 [Chitinophaga ginsengisoli]|uniref:Uncharacterized protein n=1 Tax=Chitinophaga ginsengisoli TaxID=363837 RepID=A0A2P8GHZ6_9BACT|nr:hypothetical protein CLV42_103582 [Chitinophaga ginsengisoli]